MKSILILSLLMTSIAWGQDYQDDCLDSLQIPADLSPNGDGVNDSFSINFACPPEEFEFTFYNRWGSEIYKSRDYQFHWTGLNNDKDPVHAGVLIYVLKYTFNGTEVKKTGSLTLLR
jgi:gliding motility-associated-like protein